MTILSNTNYDWRIDLIQNYAKIGEAKFKSCTIDFVENADVTRTMKVKIPKDGFEIVQTLIKQDEEIIYFDGTRCFDGTWCFSSTNGIWVSTDTQFDMFVDRLRPIMIIDGVEHSFGDFVIISAPLEDDGKEYCYDIEAYDETMIIKQSALTERKYYAAGTEYMQIISSLVMDCGLSRLMGDDTSLAITIDHEYAIGTPHLQIINELLEEINYSHIYAGTNGYLFLTANGTKFVGDYTYTDDNSTIVESIKSDSDIYSLPNIIVGYTSSPDTETVLKYVKVNDDINSVISTTRRGYNVVQTCQFNDCPNLATLKAAVDNKFMEATQATESVTIKTIPDGNHNYASFINFGQKGTNYLYREVGWTVEFGGFMTHKLERKVYV